MSDVDWRTIETDLEIQLAQERQDNERLQARVEALESVYDAAQEHEGE